MRVLKENWFKVGVLIALLLAAGSIAYYLLVAIPQQQQPAATVVRQKGSRQMLRRRLVSLSHAGTATGIVSRICCCVVTIGDHVKPVNPFLITVSTSSRDTPRRVSIS
jgi:hypothetical protein